MKKRFISLFVIPVFMSIYLISSFAAVNTALNNSSRFQGLLADDPHNVWHQLTGISVSWPDNASEVNGAPVTENKLLAQGESFQIAINAPDKVVCANGNTIIEQFTVEKSDSYQGSTTVKQVSRNYNASMKALVFDMKATSVDKDNPFIIMSVNCTYNNTHNDSGETFETDQVGIKDMKLWFKSATTDVGGFIAGGAAAAQVDDAKKAASTSTAAISAGATVSGKDELKSNRKLSETNEGAIFVAGIGIIGMGTDSDSKNSYSSDSTSAASIAASAEDSNNKEHSAVSNATGGASADVAPSTSTDSATSSSSEAFAGGFSFSFSSSVGSSGNWNFDIQSLMKDLMEMLSKMMKAFSF